MRLKLETLSIQEDGCLSQLLDESGERILYTLERTFENLRVVIPPGVFKCVKSYFHRGGYWTYEITGIEGHSRVLFHKGNKETDSLACPLVGLSTGKIDGKLAVLQSGAAFAKFTTATHGLDEFELEVTGRYLIEIAPVVVTT